MSFLVNTLAAKWLALLRELVPSATVVGDLVNPTNPNSEAETKDRWADGQIDRLAELAADLVRKRVAVIVTVSDARAAMAAKAATATIPIVFTAGVDPVKSGLVPTLNRPGGNVTGMTYVSLGTKRFGLLHQLLPAATTMAFLFNPTGGPESESEVGEMQAAAHDVGQPIVIFGAGTATDMKGQSSHVGSLAYHLDSVTLVPGIAAAQQLAPWGVTRLSGSGPEQT